MNKPSSRTARRGRHAAFSRLELIVLVDVLLVLLVIGFFGGVQARERLRRSHCRDNLGQIFKVLALYTQDYNYALPDCTAKNPKFFGGIWPWDLHTNLVDNLQKRGLSRDALYCPSNPGMNNYEHWEISHFNEGPIHVTGYGFLLNGKEGIPVQYWHTNLLGTDTSKPSETVLLFDATASIGGDYSKISSRWDDRSSHLTPFKGNTPAGGNLLHEDGHADWQPFKNMQHRFTTPGKHGIVTWDF